MTEEPVQNQPILEKDPATIPMEDRAATLTIIWTKTGQIYTSYPTEHHYAVKMLGVALNAVADAIQKSYVEALQRIKSGGIGKEPLIVPASALPQGVDPRFLRKE
jgi:hypothetical protein